MDAFHEMYNASSLLMLSKIFLKVEYYTSREVFENTTSLLNFIPKNINFKYIPIIASDNLIGHFLRQFLPIITSIYILCRSKRNDIVFFNFNALWSFSTINLLARLFKLKIIIVCHGEMENLSNGIKLNFLSNLALNKFKSETYVPPKNMFFCVLSKRIKDNLQSVVSAKVFEKIISFELSYIFKESVNKLNKSEEFIRIGFLGSLRDGFKLDNLINLAKKIDNKKIKLYSLGRIYCDKKILENLNIHIIPDSNNRFLSRKELDDYIANMHFILFLNPSYSYNFTASAAILDAIDNEKPILALKNNCFNFIFSKISNPGVLFENITHISDYINKLDKFDSKIDFKEIKQKLSVKTSSFFFKNELIKNKIIDEK